MPKAWWSTQVVPRITHVALGRADIDSLRRRALAPAQGRVVELGYGSGPTLPHYPDAVTEVLAVEPSAVGRRLAAPRERASRIPVRHIGLDGRTVPVEDASADTVVSTFTLCTVPDPASVLAEIGRLLRPGGRFLFLEHGLAPSPRTQAWQHRLTPLQRRVFDGCHLDRPIDDLVAASDLELTSLSRERMRGPRPVSSIYLGAAHA